MIWLYIPSFGQFPEKTKLKSIFFYFRCQIRTWTELSWNYLPNEVGVRVVPSQFISNLSYPRWIVDDRHRTPVFISYFGYYYSWIDPDYLPQFYIWIFSPYSRWYIHHKHAVPGKEFQLNGSDSLETVLSFQWPSVYLKILFDIDKIPDWCLQKCLKISVFQLILLSFHLVVYVTKRQPNSRGANW